MIFMSCTLLIRACMDSMTDTEKRIADYLLIHGSDAMHMNAKELAVSCDTSPAAVVRFAKKLGFKGFTALKLDLARESAQAAFWKTTISPPSSAKRKRPISAIPL